MSERSEGNPLHAIEMIKLLRERGVIEIVSEKVAKQLGVLPNVPPPAAPAANAPDADPQAADDTPLPPIGPIGDGGSGAAVSSARQSVSFARQSSVALSTETTDKGSRRSAAFGMPRSAASQLFATTVEVVEKEKAAAPKHVVLLNPEKFDQGMKAPKELLPDSLKAIVTERIDNLTTSLQLLLKTCSVVCNGDFELMMVIAVHPTTLLKAEALRLMTQLEALEIILGSDEAGVASRKTYCFASTLVQEVIYKMLPQQQRRDLHRKAAIEIRSLIRNISYGRLHVRGVASIRSHLAQLAHHYTHSGEVKPALQFLSMAAQAALDDNSPEAALNHFEEALKIIKRRLDEMSRDAAKGGGEHDTRNAYGGIISAEMLDRVHAHVLQQSAFCCVAMGELNEGVRRLALSLQMALAEDPHFLDPERMSHMLLSWKCFRQGVWLYVSKRLGHRLHSYQSPSPEALQEAIDVVACSPLIEGEIVTSFLPPRKRYWHRVAATYEQLAVALEAVGHIDNRFALYCAQRGALLASGTPFLTPTLARCYATLSLIHTSHAASGEDECWRLDTHFGHYYHRLAHEAFGTTALVERSKSDLAWGLLTEGLVVADAGKWERALEALTHSGELLLVLHAVRLWDECMVHIAFVHIARGEFDIANVQLERVLDSCLPRGDVQVRRLPSISPPSPLSLPSLCPLSPPPTSLHLYQSLRAGAALVRDRPRARRSRAE